MKPLDVSVNPPLSIGSANPSFTTILQNLRMFYLLVASQSQFLSKESLVTSE